MLDKCSPCPCKFNCDLPPPPVSVPPPCRWVCGPNGGVGAPAPTLYWTCDQASKTCKSSTSPPGFGTKQLCEMQCQPLPADLKYSCSPVNGQCFESLNGTMTLDECRASCKRQNYYKCDSELGCIITSNPDGAYSTLEECRNNCEVVVPEPQRYFGCNDTNGICSEVPYETDYLTLDSCKAACKIAPPQVYYECNSETGGCTKSANQTNFTSQADCEAKCELPPIAPAPTPQYYSCTEGVCAESQTKTDYTSLTDCQTKCKKPPVSTYLCKDGKCNVSTDPSGYGTLSACEAKCKGGLIPESLKKWIIPSVIFIVVLLILLMVIM